MNRLLPGSALLAALLTLAACGTAPLQEVPVAEATRAAADSADVVPAVPGNPYLENRRPVPRDAQQRFEQALAAIGQGDTEAVLAELHHLADTYPQLSGPGLNLALLYQQRQESELAEHWFRRSLASNPLNVTAWNQFAIFLREQGRFAEAEKAYLEALAIWEWHADSHRNIGVLYDLYMGDQERALHHFYRYQELTGADDRAVARWIADLERQLMLLVQGD
jgi:Tfp pilus assembly protein PilF